MLYEQKNLFVDDCLQHSALQEWWDRDTTGQPGSEAEDYFFFRFARLSLKGPLIASATASRARRLMAVRVLFCGNASGWPIFQSVIWRFGFPVLVFVI
jgi:hypothetical protein